MKKGVVQTKFWKRGLAATLAAAMLCGNFLEVGSSLKVFAEDGVASNAGVTVNIDTDFSTLTLENVPSNVDIPLNIQVDEAELTAKTENLEEEQKSAAQNAYQAEMQAGFEQKLNELLEGKSVVDYTGAQDAPNIGVVTAVSFDENGSVDDISFIGVNTGAESREITVSLTHPIEVDKAASGLQTVELDAQLNLDAFKEEEAPDNDDQSESETETPDNGDQSQSETETPDNGDQSESETETPDNGDQSESETETPDNGDQTESETETPDNGDQSEGDEFNSKNQELTPDSTPAGVTNQFASYSELTDHFSVGTNDDLSNLEDPDKETTPPTDTETPEETTPPEEPEIPDDMPKNYWNISANPKVNEGTISFTEAISPAANFAVEEASDTALISALSFMVPGESITQVGLKGHGGFYRDDPTPIPDFPDNPGTGSGESVETHFSASKTSSEKPGAGIYDITLMVDGIDGTKLTEEVAEQNVLFVIDLSNSMEDHGKWDTLKSAVKSMTDTLEAANWKNGDKIKVGIVGYAGAADNDDKYKAAVNISDFTTPEQAYNEIRSANKPGDFRNEDMNGGTNCEAGALKAIEMLQGQKNPTTIIYLSDGTATYAYKENGEQKGTGSKYQDDSTLEQFAQEARTVLEAIADKGYQIHTIGFGWNGEFNTLLKNGKNITYHSARDTEDLAEIFNDLAMSITGQKVANTDVTVTDPMSEHVDIAKADGSLFMTGNKLMSTEEQVDAIEQDPSALDITFKKTTYQMGPDGKPVMGDDGKPQVNDTVTVTSTSEETIDGKNYDELLKEVSFDANAGVVQLTWTPGAYKNGHRELSGKYELTYTVNVKADQDNFVSSNNYDANGETKVSGSVDGGTPSTSFITVPTVQQTQNTLTIKKTGTDNKTLSGAEFVVSFKDDAGNTQYLANAHSGSSAVYTDTIDSAQHFTTDNNGIVTINGLYDYIYTVKEVKAPSGYSELGQSFTVNFTGKEGKVASGTVDKDGNGTVSVSDKTDGIVTVQNAPSTGSIIVNKVLQDASGKPILNTNNPAFKVKLTKDDEQIAVENLTWNNDTKAYNQVTFEDLEAGTYTITEYLADGITSADTKYNVSGTGSTTVTSGQTAEVTITNKEKADGSITVTKELKGYDGSTPQNTDVTFHFGLYQNDQPFKKDGNHYVVDVTPTLTNGTYTDTNTFLDLPYGEYTVKEVVKNGDQWTPVGNDFDYSVTVNGSTDTTADVTLSVTHKNGEVQFTNTEKNNGQISVTKTVTEPTGNVTPAPLNGDEVFYVALYQGNEIFTGATVNGIDPVESGIYLIHDGETLTFSNLPYGNYIVKEVVKNGNNWVEVDNNDKNFDFTVTYNNQNINVHNSQVNTVTITNTRKVEGSIVLKKVIDVPSNVPGDNKTFTFQITGDGITTPISVTVEPDSATGALQEVDLLQALKDAGVTEIYGKKFTITEILQDSDNYTLESIGSTSEAKPNTSTGLKGFLEALLAPRNADPSCTFTPERNKSITITATNTAKTGSIEINKVDNVGNALPDVTFGLFTDEAATTPFTQNGAQVTATTGNDGTATFSNVPVGTYYLKETAVPEGYDVSGVIFEVTVTSNGTTTVTKDTEVVSDTQPEFTDNKLINTPTAITPEIKVTKAAAIGDEAFIKADNKEYTVQITGNEFSEAVTLNNAKSWTGTISDFALMPNVKYTVSETVPEGAHWALNSITITFKDSSGNTVKVDVDKDNSFTLKPEQASQVRSIEIVVTNKANRSEVQLEVTEQVIGNLLEAEKNTFNFTVTGPDGTFTGLVSVTNGDVTNVSGWRDADSAEVAELPKLIPGETYTITQTSNPEYLLDDIKEGLTWNGASNSETRTFTFTVPEDAKGTYTVAFTNYANTIPVTLTKVLEDDALPLNPDDQFDFDITTIQDDGHAFTTEAAVTTTNSATFNLIKGKTYTIKEVAIPDGYQLVSIAMNGEVLPSTKDVNPSYRFTIPTDATVIKLVATNRILGSYDFIKMGKVTTITQRPNGTVISRTETTNLLAGATFTLKDEDGVLLQTVESAADGKVSFNNLPVGKYVIEEASAPSGFNKWNYQIDLTLSIDGDRDMIINAEPTDDRGTEVKDYMLYIYNYREDIITEQDPPIPPTDPEDPGDPRPSGGGDETTTRTIEDTPTPTTTIEDEDVPLAPLPNDMITIDDEDVPLGDLPYTGGLPFELVGVLGIALVGAGLVLRKKNKKD